MERHPDWLLLNTTAVAGRNHNATTATDRTRNGKTIEVSLSPEHPPHPSTLFVDSSDMNACMAPTIVRAVEDLLLLSVNLGSWHLALSTLDRDYFIYRAHPSRPPSLQRLPHPNTFFHDNDVGVLPRPDGQYTFAVLLPAPTISLDHYKLHMFHSQIRSWSCTTVSVEAPQQPFPVKIPRRSSQLHQHLTSTMITIGGEGGTMGWVDLWRGIVFCDVLEHMPSLRGVPFPLPLKELGYDYGKGTAFGPGWQHRGITFVRDKACCLKLVHLEIDATRLPFPFRALKQGLSLSEWMTGGSPHGATKR
ncbi:uncharacterized protein C2845_PM03G18940 [Panicum miliaceum]|uniref:DUF1618 domain-containing protein n=1 Tax=Panicum miliaceum TaxID=4540 RepID=A0A3L6TAS2_PANMI|nr:uncharacterized protein C2845_PM03G18940 [Panicum miliaceum]